MMYSMGSSLDVVILRIQILMTHHMRMLTVLADMFRFIMSEVLYLTFNLLFLVWNKYNNQLPDNAKF